jgi:hypothetical protein
MKPEDRKDALRCFSIRREGDLAEIANWDVSDEQFNFSVSLRKGNKRKSDYLSQINDKPQLPNEK